MKKSLLAFGMAAMLVGGNTASVLAFTQIGTPTATWILKNNSNSSIELSNTNCGANTTYFPDTIDGGSTKTASSKGNYSGVYACIVTYKLQNGYDKCKFNVLRTAPGLVWAYPTVTLMEGNSSQCSGHVVSANSDASGNFTVQLTYDLD